MSGLPIRIVTFGDQIAVQIFPDAILYLLRPLQFIFSIFSELSSLCVLNLL